MILSLIPYQVYPPVTGGRKAIVAFTEHLAARAPLIAVTVRKNEPALANGFVLYNSLSDSPLRYINPSGFFLLRRLIRKHKVKYVLLEHPYFGWLGILLKKCCGVKLIVRSHNIEAERWRTLKKWWWPILHKYEGVVHRCADMSFFIQPNDRSYAIERYHLAPSKAFTITYGIERSGPPSEEEKKLAAAELRKTHGIDADETIFLFNGTLSYGPNAEAVKVIASQIHPQLKNTGIRYKIIICGKGLPEYILQLGVWNDPQLIHAGFVQDIECYFKGADVFLNPVVDGGGIKTKLVEALAANTRCISTTSGSIGVSPEDGGENLYIVPDNDWTGFAQKMMACISAVPGNTPPGFYRQFNWEGITQKALRAIEDLT